MIAKIICYTIALHSLCFAAHSQSGPCDAEAFYVKAMTSINARHIAWIEEAARTANKLKMSETEIKRLASGYARQKNLNDMDIMALVFLVMKQAHQEAVGELRDIMDEVRRINEEKQKTRESLLQLQKMSDSASIQKPASSDLNTGSPKVCILWSTQKVQTGQAVMQLTANINFPLYPTNEVVDSLESKTGQTTVIWTATKLNYLPPALEIKQVIDSVQSRLNVLNDQGDIKSVRLQMTMDRMTKMMETMSNLLKKVCETAETITKNLK